MNRTESISKHTCPSRPGGVLAAAVLAILMVACQDESNRTSAENRSAPAPTPLEAGAKEPGLENRQAGHEGHEHGKEAEEAGHEGHEHGKEAKETGHEGHEHGKEAEEAGHEGHEHGEEAKETGHEGHEHGHEGHAHEGSRPGENLPLEELAGQRCEHDMAQLDCDECRYELGVVRVPQAQQAALLAVEEVSVEDGGVGKLVLRCDTGRSSVASSTVIALVQGRVVKVHRTLGERVKSGEPLFTLLSDEFARIRLDHETSHQRLELAKARQQQFVRTQSSLKVLLDKLAATPDAAVTAGDLSGMPLGKSKAELLESSSQHGRALSEWKRYERLQADTDSLIRRLRGGSGSVDGLKVGEVKGRLLQAKADLSLADRRYRRAKELAGQGVVAKNDLELASRDLEAAQALFKAALEQAELDLEAQGVAAKEALDSSRARLQGAMEQAILDADLQLLEVTQEVDRCTSEVQVAHRQMLLLGIPEAEVDAMLDQRIAHEDTLEVRAAADGVLVAVTATPGQVVEKGVVLAELADTSRVWVWCDIFEKDLALLAQAKLPLPALVTSDAFPGRSFPGQLDFLAADSDASSRTVKARVTAGSEGLLRPGMYVKAAIQGAGSDSGVWIPQEAVVEDGEYRFVFIQWKDQDFVRRYVHVGPPVGGRVPVVTGLTAGERLVVRGAFYLKSDVLREKMGAGCAD